MPGRLREALDSNAEAKAAWESLTPSYRREILTYLNFIKTETALERIVRKEIAELLLRPAKGLSKASVISESWLRRWSGVGRDWEAIRNSA